MLKKLLAFLNETVENPLFQEKETSIWTELENDIFGEDPEERNPIL